MNVKRFKDASKRKQKYTLKQSAHKRCRRSNGKTTAEMYIVLIYIRKRKLRCIMLVIPKSCRKK